jgi:hypothetical protein
MELFSHRKGIRPSIKSIQKESIDQDLRNRLWSGLKIGLWDHLSGGDNPFLNAKLVENVHQSLWLNYFKEPIDSMPILGQHSSKSAYDIIREYFFKAEWWQVYDMIEYIVFAMPDEWKEDLKTILNSFMESENAAYRIVGDKVTEIACEHEIESIESALNKGVKATRSHLSHALDLMSDRKKHDYGNSIKESISAVEAACQVLSGKNKATLGDCVKILKSKGTIHPSFEIALVKLYNYTNDEGGIRHALTEESVTPAYSDAKFMLVASSAFVNFLWTKASELDIPIKN